MFFFQIFFILKKWGVFAEEAHFLKILLKTILENNKKIATEIKIGYLTWLLERCCRANKHAHHNETCFQRVLVIIVFPFLGEIEKSTHLTAC
jgi:hypothetical protein